jgi:hypothetical protein
MPFTVELTILNPSNRGLNAIRRVAWRADGEHE